MRLEKSNQWVKIFCRQRLDSLYNRAVVVPESFVQYGIRQEGEYDACKSGIYRRYSPTRAFG